MPIVHILRPGETLVAVAGLYGFRAWETIAEAPENADLIAKRKNPHALEAGDGVQIPDPRVGERVYSTGDTHRAVVRRGRPLLELRVYTEFRRVPDGIAAGVKTGTIRGWILGSKVPPLPVREASISIGPGGTRSGQTDRKGRLRVEALTDGQWNLRLDPQADELSPGPALPDAHRDHGLDWGEGNVPRTLDGRNGRLYEIEYRPLDLQVFVFGGVITSVSVVNPKRDDRPHHAVCFWLDGVEPGGTGVSQVLEIDLKPDFVRKLKKDGVWPRTQKRPKPPKGHVGTYPELFEIHHTGGNLISGALQQFMVSKSGIHFLNDRDGHVVRMADDRYEVRHGGGKSGSVVCAWRDAGNMNGRALGVENVQGKNAKADADEQPFTDEQIASLIGLVRSAMGVHEIAVGDVFGHGDVYTGKARGCPGPMFPWKSLEDAGVVTRPFAVADAELSSAFAGYFGGADGAKRKLAEGDFERKETDGTWSVVRGNKVVADSLAAGPIQFLNACLHLIGYVPNRTGKSPAAWDDWAETQQFRTFGRGTRASVQCFKGHYGAIDRALLSKASIVDIDTARLIYGCFKFAAAVPARASPEE